jgi:hypothetical protein
MLTQSSPMSNEEVDALLARLGYAPDRLVTREGASELLALLGVPMSPRTLAKNSSLRRPGPAYRTVAGRALYSPRDLVRWTLDRPVASEPTKEAA